MKILVVSHNCFDNNTNVGRTLMSYFNNFNIDEIAQFFIYNEEPKSSPFKNHYRFTDIDAIKSLFFLRRGTVFNSSYNSEKIETNIQNEIVNKFYQYGSNRSPFIYFARNMVWKLSHFLNKRMKDWLDNFKPDVIFFQSGDYSFMYRVVLKIQKHCNCPLITMCMDDFYINSKDDNTLMGRYVHKNLLKYAKKVFDKSLFGCAICDKMAEDYKKIFNNNWHVLHTGSMLPISKVINEKGKKISYLGNLSFNRNNQLVKIGRTLQSIDKNLFVDVYSAEKNNKLFENLTKENGIIFHGSIPYEEVMNVYKESMLVIHTESFEKDIIKQIKYSISTKIADSLMAAPCILAFGPEELASIDYLKKNNAAYIISKEESLKESLNEIINNSNLRETITKNARKLANENHNANSNCENIKKWINEKINTK